MKYFKISEELVGVLTTMLKGVGGPLEAVLPIKGMITTLGELEVIEEKSEGVKEEIKA